MPPTIDSDLYTPYAGRWIALTPEGLVAGTGESGPAALHAGRHNWPKVKLDVRYVPDLTGRPLLLSPLLARLEPVLAQIDAPVYLVGGAVRDAVLGRISQDLDFAVPAGGVQISFKIGNLLRAPAYVLDEERDTGRVILSAEGTSLDFVAFRGETLEDDLWDRDLTINAIALPALARTTAELIDPTGGLPDLLAGVVRQVHGRSLTDDPVRGLRAVRLARQLDFRLDAATEEGVRAALTEIDRPSKERVRDELLKLLDVDGAGGIDLLRRLGVLDPILPEIGRLDGVTQSAPHREDVLAHTITTLRYLEAVLAERVFGEKGGGLWREELAAHLEREVAGALSGVTLLRLGALFHDVGKPATRSETAEGRIRFLGHDKAGVELAAGRLRALKLSREAVGHVAKIVREHMRPLYLRQEGGSPSPRALHRFFRRAGSAGVDVALLSLADHLATYGGEGEPAVWASLNDVVDALLAHYFTREDPAVRPEPLLSGRDLIETFGLTPGPQIGKALRALAEAQAAAEIETREEALRFVREGLKKS